jgi:hypothetical protein
MMAAAVLRKVDHSGLRTGQAITIIVLLLGFVLNSWVLVAFVAVSQFLAALDAPFAPYRFIYQRIVKPSGLVKPHVIDDNPEPHRFAQLIGSIFNGTATVLLLAGVSTAPWVLVWIVIALANVNFWLNICLGCLMYYQLNRLHIPGFTHAPLPEQQR